MTTARFRAGLLAYIASILALIMTLLFPLDVPAELQQAYDAIPSTLLLGSEPLTWALLVAGVCASIAGWVGLYRLRNWGRVLSLWGTLASLLVWPLLGVSVVGGLEAAIGEASTLLWGALLACAYWSPVARAFDDDAHDERVPA